MTAHEKLVEFVRTLTEGEHTDAQGRVWLLWKDRSVLLSAYEERT